MGPSGGRASGLLRFDPLNEAGCVQFPFKQIGEISLHETLRLFLDLGVGPRFGRLAVARALKMTQIFERFDRDGRQVAPALRAARADRSARQEREELVFRQDLASAVGAFEKLGTESEKFEQAHLIVTDHQPWVRSGGKSGEAFRQKSKERRVGGVVLIGEAVQQFHNIRSLPRQAQVFAQRLVGVNGLGLCDDIQVAAFSELQRDMCERFDVARFPGGHLARPFCDGARLAALARVERQQTVSLAPVAVTQDDGFGAGGTKICQFTIYDLRFQIYDLCWKNASTFGIYE